LDGVDVSRRIRNSDVTAGASRVSVHPRLRAWMVQQQRKLGEKGGVVMEGRDIGTAVFPDAEVKIFLDAAPEVRGNRRFRQALPVEQLTAKQIQTRQDPDPVSSEQQKATQEAVLEEMRERDRRDRTRAESPLRPAEDAVILDSTAMTLQEVLEHAEKIVRDHLPKA
jgi:cytidylate kinase